MAGDRITNEPRKPGLPPVPPEPDEDAPPRPERIRLWTASSIAAVVGCGALGGYLGWMAGMVLSFFTGLDFVPFATGFVGLCVGVGVGVRYVRGLIGRGVRVMGEHLPRGARPPQPPLPSPGGTGITQRPGRAALGRRHVARFEGTGDAVTAVAVWPGGELAASAGGGRVHVWDVQTGQVLHALSAFRYRTAAVAVSPDGRLVAAGGAHAGFRQNGVLVWDAESGQLLRTIEIPEAVWSLAFLPDGRQVAVGGTFHVRVWELEEPRPTGLLPLDTMFAGTAEVRGLAASADGRLLLAGCAVGSPARLVNLERGEVIRTFTGHRMGLAVVRGPGVPAVAFAPDGMRALTGSWDQTARVWDVATARELTCFRGHCGWWGWRGVVGVAWLGDARAASVSEDGVLCVWDAATGEELGRHHHGGGVAGMAATADGRLALTGGRDGVVRVWDLD